tara:strand:- start:533 stop:847 length:315 start_codon:yes stop_codon:yes gene_type:complete
MHAAVSTLQTGRPSIALSYSAKYAGVIGGDMGLPELVIESADKELWKDGIVNEIKLKIDFIDENYISLTQRIKGRVLKIKEEQSVIMNICGDKIISNKGETFFE